MRSRSVAYVAGSLAERLNMSASMPGASGEVCTTMKSEAERSAGSATVSTRSASMPPAEAPTTIISLGMKTVLGGGAFTGYDEWGEKFTKHLYHVRR